MRSNIFRLFFALACIGWISGLTVHVMALNGETADNAVWILHIGIFLVWLPFIIRVKLENKGPEGEPGWNPRSTVQINKLFVHAPTWMRVIAVAGFIYCFVNMLLVQQQKFTETTPEALRSFSGAWIAFYGVAAAGLFPEKQKVE